MRFRKREGIGGMQIDGHRGRQCIDKAEIVP